MVRAYSDRALFERFKVRFVVAPVALLAVCIWSSLYNVQAIQLVALAWGIWHGMMQTYGFCRIYDAKASAKAAARARADLALCFAWFLAAVLLSPMRFRSSLDLYYESGSPVIPPSAIEVTRLLIVIALGLVTAVFLWRQWRDWRTGRGASPVKLLLVSSIAFWWYCNNGVQNILVGIALFEVFHDVQYLAIVWIYNRSRVERDNSIGGFMRFLPTRVTRSGRLSDLSPVASVSCRRFQPPAFGIRHRRSRSPRRLQLGPCLSSGAAVHAHPCAIRRDGGRPDDAVCHRSDRDLAPKRNWSGPSQRSLRDGPPTSGRIAPFAAPLIDAPK